MKPSGLAFTTLPLVLLFLGSVACGDDGGNIFCAEGTVPLDGLCVPQGNGPLTSPASRRVCNTSYGPVDDDALFVNGSYTGSDSDGSKERPFRFIQEAIDASSAGQEIGIAAGTYTEGLDIATPLSLEGRCAAHVVIQGSVVVRDTGGVALRGVTVTSGIPGVLVDNVQAAGTDEFGLELRFIVVSDNQGAGIEIDNSAVRIQDSEFTLARQIAGGDINQLGSGVFVRGGSNIDIQTSVVGMNGFIGIDMAGATGAPAFVDGDGSSKAAPNAPSTGVVGMNGIIDNEGGGIRVLDTSNGILPTFGSPGISIIGNEFDSNFGVAIEVNFASVEILGNTLVGASDSLTGIYMNHSSGSISNNSITSFLEGGIDLETSVSVDVVSNDILSNTKVGILAHNCDNIAINRNRIEATVTTASPLNAGHGIVIHSDGRLEAGIHNMAENSIVDNQGAGIAIEALDNLVDDQVAQFRIIDSEISRNGFAGINVNNSPAGEMFGNVLDGNAGFGIRCEQDEEAINDRVFFDGNEVTNTLAVSPQTDDGDGVLIVGCHISVDFNQVHGNARYGVYATNQATGGCDDNDMTDNGDIGFVNASGGAPSSGIVSGNGNIGTQSSVGDIHDQTPVTIPTLRP